mmetsp:Transcript_9408/g.11615  ORF Transcript_9408/g.11615 Transcript_9408/m.11615 type:complete len:236 (+) Transcript_9408:100-807(+)|eukprot:CAMPEP_0172497758 /NCGR_PEP_ID=MMETSP1066-20121228/104605_1 /TAXON_ID=671091 /ORGANISM="Coscinodiscus wailesii, Strain CCMP2513" /LENGTH=235 /DNA_ID=CAMNT_0013270703 /DNA_START=100 /DNA_END=807 /DNA_ORIENTATION=-
MAQHNSNTDIVSGSPPIFIDDDALLLQSDDNTVGHEFIFPSCYKGHLKGILIPHKDIVERTIELAKTIRNDFGNTRPLLLCVLKGASTFFHLLLSCLQEEKFSFTYEFIRAKSYEGTSSTGTVSITGLPMLNTQNKTSVIVIEDIIDTGITLSKMIPLLQEQLSPERLEVCSLLEKRHTASSAMAPAYRAQYVGFSIPNEFVVGFGLDFEEQYRDLGDVWVMSEYGISQGGKVDF